MPGLLTYYDKVLLHLDEYSRYDGEKDVPHAVTQDGIADRTGMDRTHGSRTVKKLIVKGLAKEATVHVLGGTRRRKVYFLTWEGSLAARELRDRLAEREVMIAGEGGPRRVRAPDAVASLSPGAGLLDVFLLSENGPLVPGSPSSAPELEGHVEEMGRAPAPRAFLGREREIGELLEWLRGEARLVVLKGPSGIGKTSTALELAGRLRGRKHLLWLNIHEWDGPPDLFRPLAQFLERTGRKRLGARLHDSPSPGLSEVSELLLSELEGLEALLIIDDLQNASRELLDALRAVVEAALLARGPRLLVLSRTGVKLCSPSERARGRARELTLGGLDAESASLLLGPGPRPGERESILAAAGGHPLHLELLGRHGLPQGKLEVREHLRREIWSGLGEGERQVLKALSVFGRPVPASAFLRPGEDPSLLDSLVEGEALLRNSEGGHDLRELMRDFVRSQLSPAEMRELHARAAEHFLGREGPGSLLEGLRHLLASGERRRAASEALERGWPLLDAGMGPALLADILERLRKGDLEGLPADRRARLLLLRGRARHSAGENDGALRDLREAAGTGGDIGAQAHCAVGSILHDACDWKGALQAFSATTGASEAVRAEALRGMGRVEWRRGRWKASAGHFSRALALARRNGLTRLAASVLIDQGNLESDAGRRAQALASYGRALEVLEREGDARETARVRNNIGAVLFYEDRWDEALESYRMSLELAERCGDVSTRAYALSNTGQVLARRGEEERALRCLDASSATFERLGDRYMLSSNLLARGILYRTLKDWERSEENFKQGLELLSGLDLPRERAEGELEYGLALKQKGDRNGARRLLRSAEAACLKLGATADARKARRELEGL